MVAFLDFSLYHQVYFARTFKREPPLFDIFMDMLPVAKIRAREKE